MSPECPPQEVVADAISRLTELQTPLGSLLTRFMQIPQPGGLRRGANNALWTFAFQSIDDKTASVDRLIARTLTVGQQMGQLSLSIDLYALQHRPKFERYDARLIYHAAESKPTFRHEYDGMNACDRIDILEAQQRATQLATDLEMGLLTTESRQLQVARSQRDTYMGDDSFIRAELDRAVSQHQPSEFEIFWHIIDGNSDAA